MVLVWWLIMVNHKARRFLEERNIKLEDDFVTTLLKYIDDYKQTNSSYMKDIYSDLGISPQIIYTWRHNPMTTQSRNYVKHSFIERAGIMFSLKPYEVESLAYKAGLSLRNTSIAYARKSIFKSKIMR